MKKIIIVIAVIVIIATVILLILTHKKVASNNNAGNTGNATTGSLPSVSATTSTNNFPTGNTLTIGTPEGSVTINNFYNNAQQISVDRTSILIEQTNTYNITYYAPDSSFNILISTTPVTTVQAQAEAAFLQVLGISKNDACKLNVTIGVPESVDPNYANENIGLSFCSGSAFQAP